MLSIDRPLVSRVPGAACKGVDQAGASPVVAIARFGYVAMPDIEGGRPSMVQAQVNVLGAGKLVRPIRRASKLGGRSESEHFSVDTVSHEKWVVAQRAAEPASGKGEGQWMPMIVTGKSNRHLLRRIGGSTQGMINVPKQGRSHARKALNTSCLARSGVRVKLTDRVVVAKRPRDNITPAERRTRGVAMCSEARGWTRNGRPGVGLTGVRHRVVTMDTKRASNPPDLVGQVTREEKCRRATLKPYWGKPAVRNFRGVWGNGSYGRC